MMSNEERKIISMFRNHLKNYPGANRTLCDFFLLELPEEINQQIIDNLSSMDINTFEVLYSNFCQHIGDTKKFIELLTVISEMANQELGIVMYGVMFLLYRSHKRVSIDPNFQYMSHNTQKCVETLVDVLEKALKLSDVEYTMLQFAWEA